MKKNKATEAAQNKTLSRNDTSASNARAIIIQALRTGPQTTIDLRERWGIMAPAPRILELKLRAHNIASIPVSAYTADGVLHRGVARYVLLSEPTPANDAAIAPVIPASDLSMAGAAMNPPDWLNELESLALRFPQMGVSADLAALSLTEAWGVLQMLRKFAYANGAQ
jgi:hypothetical protein